jgi:hypothetical protein
MVRLVSGFSFARLPELTLESTQFTLSLLAVFSNKSIRILLCMYATIVFPHLSYCRLLLPYVCKCMYLCGCFVHKHFFVWGTAGL